MNEAYCDVIIPLMKLNSNLEIIETLTTAVNGFTFSEIVNNYDKCIEITLHFGRFHSVQEKRKIHIAHLIRTDHKKEAKFPNYVKNTRASQ